MLKIIIKHAKSILLILATSFIIAGCNRDEHDHPQLTTGKQMFEFHCSPCHQKDGNGLLLNGFPAIKNTELMTYQISHKITGEEKEGRNMPSFKNMPRSEAALIAKYVKSLKH